MRMLRLNEPIKEIKNDENGSIGIRISGEFIEIGTEITRYPSEITETITETTRIISEDNENKNKVYNEREEEVVFQGKTFKRIIKTVEEEPESSHSSNSREKLEPEKNYPNYNNTAIKRIGNKEINQRLNELENEYYKTYSDWKSLKKYRSQNAFNKSQNIKKNDLRDNEVTVIERKRSSKDLQNGLDISDFTKEDKAHDNKEKSLPKKRLEFNTKTYKKNDINNQASLESLNSNKSDKKLKEKNIDKKTKKTIKNYKKAFKILRKMLKNRKKRNKDIFEQEKKLKLSHNFMIWVNETFPDGLDLYRQEKNSKNIILNEEKINKNNNSLGNNIINTNNKRKNEIITEKITKIIDIIRIHRKKSKKLKLKFKEKNDSEKLHICFNLWKNNVFDLDDDIDEDIFETFSSVNGNDYYNEKNKKIINSINSPNSISSSINSSNSNNYKKPNKNTNSSSKKMVNNKEKIEKQKKKDEKNNNISNKKTNKKSDEVNTIENGKKINNKNKAEEIEVKKIKENNNIIIIDTNINKSEKKYNNKNDKGRVDFNEEENEDEEEEEEEDDIEENNDNNNKLNGNNYTRISDIDNNRIKYINKNIKNKKDENNQKEKNISNKNRIKDKLINLFKMIDDKKILYFYFIKWHNNILFKKNSYEKNEEDEDTIIVTPRKIITKIIKNFSSVDDDIDKRKGKRNTKRESLSFFSKKNTKRILMKNEINDFKKRSKTLLTHQKKGSFIINRSENYYNDFEDDENYSERIYFNKSIKLLSSANNSSSKKKI